jgi:hypothetical protein
MPRHVDSIKCGSCQQRHATVAQVALCYARKREAEAAAEEEEQLTPREEHDARVKAAADAAGESWGLGSAVRRRPW